MLQVSEITDSVVGFEVLTPVVIFWDITPCSPLKVNRRFGGIYRPHHHGRRISRARYQRGSRWRVNIFIQNIFLAVYIE
jgi:hypothetical protein